MFAALPQHRGQNSMSQTLKCAGSIRLISPVSFLSHLVPATTSLIAFVAIYPYS
jgi:hypothetical protein